MSDGLERKKVRKIDYREQKTPKDTEVKEE